MATGAKLNEPDLAKVRIPSDVLDKFDLIVDAITSRIRDAAVRRAAARRKGAEGNRVTEEDLLRSSSAVLRKTAAELDDILRNRESSHAQIRSAS